MGPPDLAIGPILFFSLLVGVDLAQLPVVDLELLALLGHELLQRVVERALGLLLGLEALEEDVRARVARCVLQLFLVLVLRDLVRVRVRVRVRLGLDLGYGYGYG